MEVARVDQPQVPDNVEKSLQVYKVESCQHQRRLSSCKHLSPASFICELFSVFRQLRSEFWHHWIYWTACLFLWSLWNFYSVTCIHPLQYTGFNSPIHTFLCIILSSGGFTYCTYPHALGQLLRTIKLVTISKENNSNFQLAWTTCLKLTKVSSMPPYSKTNKQSTRLIYP